MALIDEIQTDGTVDTAKTLTYSSKSPFLLTIGQNELLRTGKYYSSHEISNTYIENQLGSQFLIQEFTGTDIIYSAIGSRAYYFEVDAPCTIYLEEDIGGTWTNLTTLYDTTATSFTAYKGLTSLSSTTNPVRIRFSGTTYYRIRNIALFEYPFSSDRIPDYKPWIKKQMPSDFSNVDKIVREYSDIYENDSNFKWEGKRDLYINYEWEGNIRIVYVPTPSILTSLSDSLVVDDITSRTKLPYYLAGMLMIDENQTLASYYLDKFNELKSEIDPPTPSSEQNIQDVYYITSGM